MLPSAVRQFAKRFASFYSSGASVSIERHEFIDRRRKLIARVRREVSSEKSKYPLVVVARSAKQVFSAPDVPHPYRQCSYFRYLTGITQPNAVLTIVENPNEQSTSTLYVESEFHKSWGTFFLKANFDG